MAAGSSSFALSVALFLTAAPLVQAQTPPAGPQPPATLVQRISTYRENFLAQLFQPFRNGAGADQVLTTEDIERAAAVSRAAQRASLTQIFFASDIDADDRLTSDELSDVGPGSRALQLRQGTKWDSNGDGIVTLDEMLAFAKATGDQPGNLGPSAQLTMLLDLDPNKDGRLTADELEELGRTAFAYYDRNNDGMISKDENAAVEADRSKAIQEAAAQREMARCKFATPGTGEKIFLVSAYEAGTLSNVTVAGQDEETETSELEIEAGSEPLYIAASSYEPMIWRLTGHVERVAHFVASSPQGVGVVGLARDKVTLVSKVECLQRLRNDGGDPQPMLGSLQQVFRKPVDGIAAHYLVQKVVLPSGAAAATGWKLERGRPSPYETSFSLGGLKETDSETFKLHKQFNPGGLLLINPADVIASDSAEAYQVLPQEAGLLQLLENGSIERVSDGLYRIAKPITRFPSGLNGAHSVRFIFAEGVPMPAGKLGHSRILTEKDGQSPLRGMQRN